MACSFWSTKINDENKKNVSNFELCAYERPTKRR